MQGRIVLYICIELSLLFKDILFQVWLTGDSLDANSDNINSRMKCSFEDALLLVPIIRHGVDRISSEEKRRAVCEFLCNLGFYEALTEGEFKQKEPLPTVSEKLYDLWLSNDEDAILRSDFFGESEFFKEVLVAKCLLLDWKKVENAELKFEVERAFQEVDLEILRFIDYLRPLLATMDKLFGLSDDLVWNFADVFEFEVFSGNAFVFGCESGKLLKTFRAFGGSCQNRVVFDKVVSELGDSKVKLVVGTSVSDVIPFVSNSEWILDCSPDVSSRFSDWHAIVSDTSKILSVFSLSRVAPSCIRLCVALSGKKILADFELVEEAAQHGMFVRSMNRGKIFTSFQLEAKNFSIRHATFEKDADRLIQLEAFWSDRGMRSTLEQIKDRFRRFPRGQFVLLKDHEIAGAVYSQRVQTVESISTAKDSSHASGNVVQLLGALSDPNFAAIQPGNLLIEYIVQLSSLMGLEVCAVTRWSSFKKWKLGAPGRTAEQYFALGTDPTVNWHTARGAFVLRLLPAFRPEDSENDGFGVLVSYKGEKLLTPKKNREHFVLLPYFASLEKVKQMVSEILCVGKEKIPDDGSLFSLGLDSLGLFELREKIAECFHVPLPPPTIFFQYSRISLLAKHFSITETMAAVVAALEDLGIQVVDPSASLQSIGVNENSLLELKDILGRKYEILSPVTLLSSCGEISKALVDSKHTLEKKKSSVAQLSENVKLSGFSCVVGNVNVESFWENLVQGRDFIRPLPSARTELIGIKFEGGYFEANTISSFDSGFWSISPREARLMDPQQKLCLTHSWHALEDAGIDPMTLMGSTTTGAFFGIWNTDFRVIAEGMVSNDPQAHFGTGSASSIVSGRIAFCFGIEGATATVDTACSSGLVALTLAIDAMKNNSLDSSLVGAANVFLSDTLHKNLSAAGMLSPESRCKTFDASANGYVRSEACAVLFLSSTGYKTSILGSAVNQDGRSGGLTVPNQNAQERLYIKAFDSQASVKFADMNFFEAHGTGTSLGDPIEVHSISNVFQRSKVVIGSGKAYFGHSEAVAGLLGLIKVISGQGKISKQLHFCVLNPHIGEDTLVKVQGVIPLESMDHVVHACISSFGFSGTNAHVIVRTEVEKVLEHPNHVLIFSAKTEKSLFDATSALQERLVHLKIVPNFINFGSLTWISIISGTRKQLQSQTIIREKQEWSVCLVFPGHGWKANSNLRKQLDFFVNPNIRLVRRGKITREGSIALQVGAASELKSLGASWSSVFAWGSGLEPCERFGKSVSSMNSSSNFFVELGRTSFQRGRRQWIHAFGKRESSLKRAWPCLVGSSFGGIRFKKDEDNEDFSVNVEESGFYNVADHKIFGVPVLPGAFHLSLIFSRLCSSFRRLHLKNIEFLKPVLVDAETTILYKFGSNTLSAFHNGEMCLKGNVEEGNSPNADAFDVGNVPVEPINFWDSLSGLEFGSSFRWISKSVVNDRTAISILRGSSHPKLVFPVEFVDSMIQTAFLFSTDLKLPFSIKSINFVLHKSDGESFLKTNVVEDSSSIVKLDVQAFQNKKLIVEIEELCLVVVKKENFFRKRSDEKLVHEIEWRDISISNKRMNSKLNGALICGSSVIQEIDGLKEIVVQTDKDIKGLRPQAKDVIVSLLGLGIQSSDIGRKRVQLSVALWKRLVDVRGVNVYTVTEQAVRVGGGSEERVNPWARALWALGRCISAECSEVLAGHVMVDLKSTKDLRKISTELRRERNQNEKIGMEVALRNDRRFVAELKSSAAEFAVAYENSNFCILSGGFGALGVLISNQIHVKYKLLLGRNGRSRNDLCKPKQQSFEVDCICDISCVEKTSRALSHARINFGILSASVCVMHLAGLTQDGLLKNLDWKGFQATMRPKIGGLRSLVCVVGRSARYLLFSSITALLGNIGQTNYGCANGFLDGFAEGRSNFVSVNWGPWNIGMYAKLDQRLQLMGQGFEGSEAETLLELAGSRGDGISFGIMRVEDNNLFAFTQPSLLLEKANASNKSKETVSASNAHVVISKVIREVLGLGEGHEIDENVALRDIGFDSILSVELRAKLAQELQVDLPATLLFDYPTLHKVKQRILELNGIYGEMASHHFSQKRTDLSGTSIVGISCKFGNCVSLKDLWSILCCGEDQIKVVPEHVFKWEQVFSDSGEGISTISKWGCFVRDGDMFDASFFGISSREALAMDPKARWLLETSWNCLESANVNPFDIEEQFQGPVGVFVGIWASEYAERITMEANYQFIGVGTFSSAAAGRISYFLNLTGKCVSTDTACSSSLVALVDASNYLMAGGIAALCFGTNSVISASSTMFMSKAGMLSPDGRCKTFDVKANGYVRGEGCGALLIKHFSEDRPCFGYLVGHAINQDGRSNGLTAPNGPSQVKLIREALRVAGREGREIGVLEAHGTGTSLGDPIEVQAVAEAMGQGRAVQRGSGLVIGSAKTNFGHTETAAGVLGVLKVVACLDAEAIAQHLHMQELNGYIGTGLMEGMSCVVPVGENVEWKQEHRLAGVSSFGFSGTNAHIIIEQAERKLMNDLEHDGPFVVRVSGKSEVAVRSLAAAYAAWMVEEEGSARALGVVSISGRGIMKHVQRIQSETKKEVKWLLQSGMSNASEEHEHEAERDGAAAAGAERVPSYAFERKEFWISSVSESKESLLYEVGWLDADPYYKFVGSNRALVLSCSSAKSNTFTDGHDFHVLKSEKDVSNIPFSKMFINAIMIGRSEICFKIRFKLSIFSCRHILGMESSFLYTVTYLSVKVFNDFVMPWSRAIWAFGRVLSSEGSERLLGHVMVDLDKNSLENVFVEAKKEQQRLIGVEIAFRNGKHYVGRLMKKVATFVQPQKFELILVTGAFGGLGLIFSALDIGQAARVMLGRSSRGINLSKSSTIRDAFALCDVCKSEDVMLAVTAAKFAVGKTENCLVLHLAGVSENELISRISWSSVTKNARPKVSGLRSLHKLGLKSSMILFSSISSLVGIIGQAAYSAANGFMDGFAEQTDGAQAVNWGAWDSGMLLKLNKDEIVTGTKLLQPSEASRLLSISLSCPSKSSFGIARIDWDKNLLTMTDFLQNFQSSHVPLGRQSWTESEIHHLVQVAVREVAGLEYDSVLDENSVLQEFGFDSMLSVELAKFLSSKLDIQLPATLVFDHPTIVKLKRKLGEITSVRGSNFHASNFVAHVEAQASVSGCACRFSGARTSSRLSSLFLTGREEIREAYKNRWDWRSVGEGSRWGGFLEDLYLFDAAFFSISPREAKAMDPQHRMLLECAWEVIESASLDTSVLETQSVGVFVGIQAGDYSKTLSEAGVEIEFGSTGIASSTAAGRISYILNLTGTAVSIDTACSSSLVALIYGVKSVERGEDRKALCFGVQALTHGGTFIILDKAGMLSADGRCKTFDAKANGYVRGEGCGAVLVKRLEDRAGQSKDFGLIVGHAINQDGRSNGLTAPNGPSQVKLIREALKVAGREGREIGMLEAHGTGTSLGDPIEVQAVAEAMGQGRAVQRGSGLVIGSAKTNFGHTETAAGVLGVLKVVACLDAEAIAQHLHMQELNGYIGTGLMEGMSCVVPVGENVEWKQEHRLAGVSSFGFSGTNAHIIIEQAERKLMNDLEHDGPFVVRVSGKSEVAVRSLAKAYAAWMVEEEGSVSAFGATSMKGRCRMMLIQRIKSTSRKGAALLLERGVSNATEEDEIELSHEDDNWVMERIPNYVFEHKKFWVGKLSSLVVIIGAGMQGLACGQFFHKKKQEFLILEQNGFVGGTWVSQANDWSAAQTEVATYCLGAAEELNDFPRRDELLKHFVSISDAFKEKILFHHKVIEVVRRKFGEIILKAVFMGEVIEIVASRVIVFPGRLVIRREFDWPGESSFLGRICYGSGNQIAGSSFENQKVVVLGHGAFAIEVARTAFENGAQSVTILCRNRNPVLPKIGSWLINASSRSISLKELDSVLKVAYDLTPFESSGVEIREQSGLTPISDFYFLALRLGKLRIVVDEVLEFQKSSILTKQGHDLPCSVVIKCLGFVPDTSMDEILKLKTLNGFWVNGCPDVAFFREGRGLQGVNFNDSTAIMPLLRRGLDAIDYFFDFPAEFDKVINNLPVVSSCSEYGAFYVGNTFAVLKSKIPILSSRFSAVLEEKQHVTLSRHPLTSFLKGCVSDWHRLSKIIDKDSPVPSYFFSEQQVMHLLESFGKTEDHDSRAVQPGKSKLQSIEGLLQNVLGMEPEQRIDPDQDFLNLGLDSILFLEFAEQLRLHHNSKLSANDLLQCSTLRKLKDSIGLENSLKTESQEFRGKPMDSYSFWVQASSMQEGFFIQWKLWPNSSSWTYLSQLDEKPEVQALQKALTQMSRVHGMLRVNRFFLMEDSTLLMHVSSSITIPLVIYEQASLETHGNFWLSSPWDLENGGPFLRVFCGHKSVFFVTHPVAFDEGSSGIFLKHLKLLLANDDPLEFSPESVQDYWSFPEWQKKMCTEINLKNLDEWKALSRGCEVIQVPMERRVNEARQGAVRRNIPSTAVKEFKQIAKLVHGSAYEIFQSTYALWLSGRTGKTDFFVSSLSSLRQKNVFFSNTIGNFNNVLLFPYHCNTDSSLLEFYASAIKCCQITQDVNAIPFSRMAQEVSANSMQVLDIFFEWVSVGGMKRISTLPKNPENFLTFEIVQEEGEFWLQLVHDSSAFTKDEATEMVNSLLTVIQRVTVSGLDIAVNLFQPAFAPFLKGERFDDANGFTENVALKQQLKGADEHLNISVDETDVNSKLLSFESFSSQGRLWILGTLMQKWLLEHFPSLNCVKDVNFFPGIEDACALASKRHPLLRVVKSFCSAERLVFETMSDRSLPVLSGKFRVDEATPACLFLDSNKSRFWCRNYLFEESSLAKICEEIEALGKGDSISQFLSDDFSSFSAWEEEMLLQKRAGFRKWWKEYLKDVNIVVRDRSLCPPFKLFMLPQEQPIGLGENLSAYWICAFAIWLSKKYSLDCVAFPAWYASRSGFAGFYQNLIAVKIPVYRLIAGTKTFNECVEETRKIIRVSVENGYLPFQDLVELVPGIENVVFSSHFDVGRAFSFSFGITNEGILSAICHDENDFDLETVSNLPDTFQRNFSEK